MSRQDDLRQLIINLQRRRQKLLEVKALKGLDTPTHTILELEDTEDEFARLQAELAQLPADLPPMPAPSKSRLPRGMQVFIAYSHHDKEFVQRLAADLERKGYTTWWDVSLRGGQALGQTIQAAIDQSAACLVVLSPHSVESIWVEDEYTYALDEGKAVIPLLYRPCKKPLRLRRFHHFDFTADSAYPDTLTRLLSELSGQADQQVNPPADLPAVAAIPPLVKSVDPPADPPTITATPPLIKPVDPPADLPAIAPTPPLVKPVDPPPSLWRGMGVVIGLLLFLGAIYIFFYPPVTPTPTVFATNTPTPTPEPELPTITALDGATMLLIPAGAFTMGSDPEIGLAECKKFYYKPDECQRSWYENEAPTHTVTLDAFYIDQTEVTNARYAQCVAAGACTPPVQTRSYTRDNYYGNAEFDNYPVIYVDWNQAKSYCEWRGDHLPTEAEWEKAARGDDDRIYPWGNEFDGSKLNFCDQNCSFEGANKTYSDGYADTAPVGSYPAGVSPYGVLDLAGNVWEWTQSEYKAYPYQAEDGRENLDSAKARVLRGGAWGPVADSTRASIRNGYVVPTSASSIVGFRCLR